MTDQLAEEALQRWQGLPQSVVSALKDVVQMRVNVTYKAEGLEGEAPDIPLGLIEIVAEETIKHIPAIILWRWMQDGEIATPATVLTSKTKRGRRK